MGAAVKNGPSDPFGNTLHLYYTRILIYITFDRHFNSPHQSARGLGFNAFLFIVHKVQYSHFPDFQALLFSSFLAINHSRSFALTESYSPYNLKFVWLTLSSSQPISYNFAINNATLALTET